MKHVDRICTALLRAGRPADEPCAVVCSATTPDQPARHTLSADERKAKLAVFDEVVPAIPGVGRSVLMRQVLDWQALITGAAPRNLDPLGRGRPAEAS